MFDLNADQQEVDLTHHYVSEMVPGGEGGERGERERRGRRRREEREEGGGRGEREDS